jgi:hypothetical protein
MLGIETRNAGARRTILSEFTRIMDHCVASEPTW